MVFLLEVLAFLETVLVGAALATTFTVLVALGAAFIGAAFTVLAVALTVFFVFVLIKYLFLIILIIRVYA
jgi:hypothetical protein